MNVLKLAAFSHNGQGGFNTLSNDPMGSALITSAKQLMQKMITKDLSKK